MKKRITTCIAAIFAFYSFGQPSEVEKDNLSMLLSKVDLNSYKNLPIDSLIAHIPQSYTSLKVLGSWRTEIADQLLIEYPNNVFIEVFVFNFQYMNPHNPNKLPPSQAWSVSLMRKEKIHHIKIWNGTECINGCENR